MRKLTVVLVAIGLMAVAGGATAASQYIITNIHQIKPSVRAHLRGQRGPRGLQGSTGAQGAPGLTSVKTVIGNVVDATPCCTDTSIIMATVQCPAGSVAVAGGWSADPNNIAAAPDFIDNAPIGPNGWIVVMLNGDPQHTAGIEPVVTCALGGAAGAADANIARTGTVSVKTELAAARRLLATRAAALKSIRR